MAFVCSATWVAKEGEAHKVAEALKHLSPASRTEEGNIYYQAYQDPAEPNTFRIFEVYTDEAAFKAAFPGLGKSCQSCHEKYRQAD